MFRFKKYKIVVLVAIVTAIVLVWAAATTAATHEGLNTQEQSQLMNDIANVTPSVNQTQQQLVLVFNTIVSSNLLDPKYSAIIQQNKLPLLTYHDLADYQTSRLIVSSSDPSALACQGYLQSVSQQVSQTESMLNQFFALIQSNTPPYPVQDSTYNSVIINTNMSNIEKYMKLMKLLQNRTNF